MPVVKQRKLSIGEIRENKRRAKRYRTRNTYTYSVRIGNLHYEFFQVVKT